MVGPDEGEGFQGGRSIDQLFAGNAQGMVYRSDDLSPAELEHYSAMHDRSADVERIVIDRESEELTHKQYLAAMAAMTDRQKELIHKLIVLGKTQLEVAREEGVDPTAIRNRWKKICRKFRKFFD